MSHCTIIITKKSETELIKKEISQNNNEFARSFAFAISTKYYSQKEFKNISSIYNNFLEYDVVMIENYYSSFTNQTTYKWKNKRLDKKIEKFKKQGWSDDKIKEYREKESAKIEPHCLSSQKRGTEIEKVVE